MAFTLPIQNPLPSGLATGGSVTAMPLVGEALDEITAQVMRLKQADTRLRAPNPKTPAPTPAALNWAEDWKLPAEVHAYFTLEVA